MLTRHGWGLVPRGGLQQRRTSSIERVKLGERDVRNEEGRGVVVLAGAWSGRMDGGGGQKFWEMPVFLGISLRQSASENADFDAPGDPPLPLSSATADMYLE